MADAVHAVVITFWHEQGVAVFANCINDAEIIRVAGLARAATVFHGLTL